MTSGVRPTAGEPLGATIQGSLATVREPAATGPAPDPERLRLAYLELLKLALCDLAGASTVSVGPTPEGGVVARELRGEQRRLRSVGLDWPLQGSTMGGLARLDALQDCVESVVADGVQGDLIEAGTWRGGSAMLMRATLDTLRAAGGRTVVVADSFAGFPPRALTDAPDDLNQRLSAYDYLAVSREEVEDGFARFGLGDGVEFVRGLFADTLPGLRGRRWSLVRLDGDTYEATRVTLDSLLPGLSEGGYVVVDDYGAAEECRRAVDEYRAAEGITAPLEPVDWTCVRWRHGGGGVPAARPAAGVEDDGTSGDFGVAQSLSVPTARELLLEGELADLHARLEAQAARSARLEQAIREVLQSRSLVLAERIGGLRRRAAPALRERLRQALE